MQKFYRRALTCPSYSPYRPHAISIFLETRKNTFVVGRRVACSVKLRFRRQPQTFFYEYALTSLFHSWMNGFTVYLLFTSVSFSFDCSLQIYFINPVSNLYRSLHVRGHIFACISYLQFMFLCSYWFPVLLRNPFQKKKIPELIPF